MESGDPADRLAEKKSALLMNGIIDKTGRVCKNHGVSMGATASSLRMTATSGRKTIRSSHVYQGRNGQNPSSRLLTVLGSSLLRTGENDLMSAHDVILFPSNIDTPALDKAASGLFRQKDFYHQNGVDIPFKVACETDDGTNPSTTATILGLKPPLFPLRWTSKTAGNAKRFPPNVLTGYAVTFVYGNRGESGPSPVFQTLIVTADGTNDELGFTAVPLGESGVTARRIYRTQIGRAGRADSAASLLVPKIINGAPYPLYFVEEISDNTTTTWTDKYDDAALDYSTPCPMPRPFPPIAKYSAFHLDRIFWANGRSNPQVLGVMADPVRVAGATFTDYRVTVSNTGAGTITFEKNNAGWSTDFTVASYKTKTLKAILTEILKTGSAATYAAGPYTLTGAAVMPGAGIDMERTYTFKEVTQQSIYAPANAYWFIAIDDTTTNGLEWFPNRTWFSEIAFPEQVDGFNNFDITTGGSKKITACVHSELDGSLVLFTEDKPYIVSGDFVPALDTGVPVFRIDPAIAATGNICYRPDAVCATDIGIFYVAYDGLRLFRGERSTPVGRDVQDWFARVLRQPVARDNLSMNYHGGILRIALPTDEVP